MIAIITINYNLSKDTIECVSSILKSSYKNYKVFLIDNGSEIGDYNKLIEVFGENSKVKILRLEQNCGYVGGVNFGIKSAQAEEIDYIMVMNNDTVIDDKAIGHLVEACKRYENRAIVTGKVYYFDHPDILQHTGVVFTDNRYLKTFYPGQGKKDDGQFETELERDSLDDVFWLFPINLIKDIGYYSEYFFLYAEQGDFARRAFKAGYKLIFTPDAKLWHKESLTTGGGNTKSLKIMFWRGQGMFIFQFRHLKRKYFLSTMIKSFLKYSLKSLLDHKEERKRNFALLRGYFSGLKWLFHRKKNSGFNPYI